MQRFRSFLVSLLVVFLLAAVLVPAAAAAGPRADGANGPFQVRKTDERWAMADGAKLPVTVWSPAGAAPGATFPVVVFVHPWCCDRSIYERTAEEYASRGYVALAYTVRGWFGAEGQMSCMSPELEMADLSRIITLVSSDARFPVLKDEEGPVVGVTGYSMGGVHSYLIAPRKNPRPGDPGDPRVRAVAPQHGGADLLFSLYPNNAVKMLWGGMLVGTSYIGDSSGLMINLMSFLFDGRIPAFEKMARAFRLLAEWRPVSNVTPDLLKLMATAMQRQKDREAEAKAYIKVRSARWWCDEEMDGTVEHPLTVPTLITTGWHDDIFAANEGLAVFSAMLEAPGRIIVTNHGHAGGMSLPAGTPSAEQRWVAAQIAGWFDHFLKGIDNGAEREPRVRYYRDWSGDYGSAPGWPAPGTSQATLYMGGPTGFRQGKLSADPPPAGTAPDVLLNWGIGGSISIPYFNDAPEMLGLPALDIPEKIDLFDTPFQRYGYVSGLLASSVVVQGSPLLHLAHDSSGSFAQLTPRLYEVKPDGKQVLITRGWYEGYAEKPWTRAGTGDRPAEMSACCHRMEAGSRFKLEFTTADMVMTWPLFGLSLVRILHDGPDASRIVIPVAPD